MEIECSNPNSSGGTESESSSHGSRFGEVELDAARALADLAKIEKERIDLNDFKFRNEPIGSGSHDNNEVSEDVTPERTKANHDSELSIPNTSCTSSRLSSFARRMKQDMTEAEREEKRFRRVLANRESARQTIRRRQALREELIKKVSGLSVENTNMKMEKELVMREYHSLEETNKKLKEQVAYAIKVKVKSVVELKPNSPSTELSLEVSCPSVLTCNKARYEEDGSNIPSSSNTHFYAPPPPICTLFYPILAHNISQSYASAHQHAFIHSPLLENLDNATASGNSRLNATPESINLGGTPIDLNQNKIFQHDPGGIVDAKRDEKSMIDINDGCDEIISFVDEKSQAAMKKLVDPNAAAAARRRRKELTKLKSHHGKQIRLHG